MLTSAQRAKLKSIAQNLDPIFHVGKNGVGDNQVNDIIDALESHELIKISVLKNAETPTKLVLDEVCERTGAEPVQAIGNKIVIYKRSEKDGVEHIL